MFIFSWKHAIIFHHNNQIKTKPYLYKWTIIKNNLIFYLQIKSCVNFELNALFTFINKRQSNLGKQLALKWWIESESRLYREARAKRFYCSRELPISAVFSATAAVESFRNVTKWRHNNTETINAKLPFISSTDCLYESPKHDLCFESLIAYINRVFSRRLELLDHYDMIRLSQYNVFIMCFQPKRGHYLMENILNRKFNT